MDTVRNLVEAPAHRPVPTSLADTINHEFRTPLATLLGHLELMHDYADQLPEDVQLSLLAMSRAGDRLRELVTAAADIAEVASAGGVARFSDLSGLAG